MLKLLKMVDDKTTKQVIELARMNAAHELQQLHELENGIWGVPGMNKRRIDYLTAFLKN